MTAPLPLLVFTDLDGTLLDHASYSYRPALPALRALAGAGAGVILASSKTAAEIAPLRDELDLSGWPAIVENGAGLLAPGTGAGSSDEDYRRLRALQANLPRGFRGFGDMDAAEVARITGLPADKAALACRRAFTEPGLWQGDEAELPAFLDAAARAGISARRGGRFLTLSFGATKADQMRILCDRFRPASTIALGDAPNDIEMIGAADCGIIIANPAATPLPAQPGEADGRIRRSAAPGPEGWCEEILVRMAELDLIEEPAPHV